MINIISGLLLIVLITLINTIGVTATIQRIEVFTTSQDQVGYSPRQLKEKQIQLTYYTLNAHLLAEKELSYGLTNNRALSTQIVKQRLRDGRLTNQLMKGYSGILKAQTYGLEKYPAIVFDGKQVIYGVRQIHHAILLYQKANQK